MLAGLDTTGWLQSSVVSGGGGEGGEGGEGGGGGGERHHRPHRPVAHARVLEELG